MEGGKGMKHKKDVQALNLQQCVRIKGCRVVMLQRKCVVVEIQLKS